MVNANNDRLQRSYSELTELQVCVHVCVCVCVWVCVYVRRGTGASHFPSFLCANEVHGALLLFCCLPPKLSPPLLHFTISASYLKFPF